MNINISYSSNVDTEKLIGLSNDAIEMKFKQILDFVIEDHELKNLMTMKNLFKQSYEEIEVDLYITNNDEIRLLNKTYRNIDAETDVLSFLLCENENMTDFKIINLGEVIISAEKLLLQAKSNNKTNLEEFIFLSSHGLLHLLGLHHNNDEEYNKVIEIQNRILEAVKNK